MMMMRIEVCSPEAKLGMKVEDLWDEQEPQLTPTEKLNACFESIPVSSFPQAPSSHIAEISSDASLAETVQLLYQHKLLCAPVVDCDASEDATWIDRYIGMVEFAAIVVWILHQSERDDDSSPTSELCGTFSTGFSESPTTSSAITAAAHELSSPRKLGTLSPRSAAITSGNFFKALTNSEFYRNTKVRDVSGSFRWAPFLALQKSNSFLTMLLLLSKYRMKSIPVVDLGEKKIDNIITQSAVIHMLDECSGLQWFDSLCTKKLSEIGLPLMNARYMIKVDEDDPVLQAFKVMRRQGVGAVPVVESNSRIAIGNISIRDIQFLLVAPEIYKDYRSITAKNFLTAVKRYKEEQHEPCLTNGMVSCKKDDTLKEVISVLNSNKIHRIYMVDDDGNLEGVITLRDIISRLVHEPHGYFGDFFDGVIPLPANSRV
ncbi:SNF1-related protein kinase regulatory subunit gamma-1 [Impatiens glandulifera]|uniref:SNF1-related protein kinase regulatory subunit gamma-1 n=1 Tax=Impatiens glandulifera TaxID=253017 RepID=UPI001FB16FEE|nr:SNF1-related protein kinase regulatory subunit gamma-1 [Impatiens glandulifera]